MRLIPRIAAPVSNRVVEELYGSRATKIYDEA